MVNEWRISCLCTYVFWEYWHAGIKFKQAFFRVLVDVFSAYFFTQDECRGIFEEILAQWNWNEQEKKRGALHLIVGPDRHVKISTSWSLQSQISLNWSFYLIAWFISLIAMTTHTDRNLKQFNCPSPCDNTSGLTFAFFILYSPKKLFMFNKN